jgi:hypothetical protein
MKISVLIRKLSSQFKPVSFIGNYINYRECILLGCDAVWFLQEPTFRGNVWPQQQLIGTANVSNALILCTLMMEVILFSETSVLTRATRRNITEDGILHSHRRANLKSYIALTGWALYRRRNVSPARYELGFISQKTAFFVVTALKTSNIT